MITHRKKEAATCSLDGAVAASIKLVQNDILTQFILQTHALHSFAHLLYNSHYDAPGKHGSLKMCELYNG